jgi:predicted transcriptional regulator
MIDTLISSKTRVKLLLKFFLNSNTAAYLRGLESEFGESTNGIRVELNRLEKAGMLKSEMEGNKKMYRANTGHPLFTEVHNILLKHIGVDQIVNNVVENLGQVERIYLAGTFARGIDGPVLDILLVGEIDRSYLVRLIERAEELIDRRIRYLDYSPKSFSEIDFSTFEYEPLLLWERKGS